MSLPTSTFSSQDAPARRRRRVPHAWTWAIIALWLVLLALLLGAIQAIGDAPAVQPSPYEPAPWMPVFSPIA